MCRSAFARRRLPAAVLALALLAGCAAGPATPGVPSAPPAPSAQDAAYARAEADAAVMDFAVRLLQHAACGEARRDVPNALVAPFSVYSALGMTAAGAEGATQAEMAKALGLAPNALGAYLGDYAASLPDDGCLHSANGIWLRDALGLAVEDSFLQFNAAHYGAAVRKAAFDDTTVADINAFVKENTAGRIESILDHLDAATMLVLANALSFDAEWEDIYREDQVQEGAFTAWDGSAQAVDFLHSSEGVFLRDGDEATGFVKYYAGRRYALAVLLPAQGCPVDGYVAGLTGARLAAALQNAEDGAEVWAAMPKFTLESSYDLTDALRGMGMPSAFDAGTADFSALGRYDGAPLYIGEVLHKAFLRVDERGTQAGAATAVTMDAGAAMEAEIHEVICDRPFVFLLLDTEWGMPLFLGMVEAVA